MPKLQSIKESNKIPLQRSRRLKKDFKWRKSQEFPIKEEKELGFTKGNITVPAHKKKKGT